MVRSSTGCAKLAHFSIINSKWNICQVTPKYSHNPKIEMYASKFQHKENYDLTEKFRPIGSAKEV